jgi:hypothetical protein
MCWRQVNKTHLSPHDVGRKMGVKDSQGWLSLLVAGLNIGFSALVFMPLLGTN